MAETETRPRLATIGDVARRVGVSTRTVSRVVRNEGGYSDATKLRVEIAIHDLGYFPNLLARGLASGRSRTMGIIGPDMNDPFFPELAECVQNAAHDRGLTMLYAQHGNNPERQDVILGSFRSHGAEGVILFPAPGGHRSPARFAKAGLPIVSIDGPMSGINLSSVCNDIQSGAEQAISHFLTSGRKRIAYIGSELFGLLRETAYKSKLGDEHPHLIERVQITNAEGAAIAMKELLCREPHIDAVFALNDVMALGAIRVLLESGRSVPDDVAVIGFDDIAICATVKPALSTVSIDREMVTNEAMEMLRRMTDKPYESLEPVMVPVHLVLRETT